MDKRWITGLLLLAGCATASPEHWAKGDGTPLDARDHYECQRDAMYHYIGGAYTAVWTVRGVDRGLYRACLGARGYERR